MFGEDGEEAKQWALVRVRNVDYRNAEVASVKEVARADDRNAISYQVSLKMPIGLSPEERPKYQMMNLRVYTSIMRKLRSKRRLIVLSTQAIGLFK
jgi:hypothetical protein